jgi:hypothetical protein
MKKTQLSKTQVSLKSHVENPSYDHMFARCAYGQTIDGEIEIFIRADATYSDLLAVHDQFGVPMAELLEFREHQALTAPTTH